MGDKNDQTYTTKSGRAVKRKFESLNFTVNKKMVLTRDDERERERESNTSQASQIEAEWEKLNQERIRLEQLKASLEAQKKRLQPTTRVVNGGEYLENARNITEGFTAIVSNVNGIKFDMTIPKLSNEMEIHPVKFLDEVQKFFKIKNVPEEKKLIVIEHALEGKANSWFRLKEHFENFQQFKNQF